MASLKDTYEKTTRAALMEALGCSNVLAVPRLSKIVVTMAFKATLDKDVLKVLTNELALITGQRPVVTKARKSISNFKLREGMPIGAKVTLRGVRMYEFFERLIGVALPRIRDFRGVPVEAFDGRGNYSLGVTEQTIFPEIDPDQVKQPQGLNVAIVTTAKDNAEALELLRRLGMPFATAKPAA